MNVPFSEWRVLSRKLIESNAFKTDRISAESLFEIYKRGRAFVRISDTDQKTIIAFGALWDTLDSAWFEMGTIWVDKGSQGKGLSSVVFHELFRLLPQNQSVFLITREDRVKKIAEGAEWTSSTTPRSSPCRNAIGQSRPLGDKRVLYYHQSA